MAYHSSKIDYQGRTVDLLLLQFVESPVSDAVVRPDVSSVPRMVTGIEKLAQRFAQIFLTQLGTVQNRDDEGTEFIGLIGSGRIYDESTLTSAATAANNSTLRQIQEEDAELSTPDDEALETSEITDMSIDRSKATISVTIQLTSASGDTYTYITPVTAGL